MRYVQSSFRVTIAKFLASVFIGGILLCLPLYGVGTWFSITEGNTMETFIAATFFYLLSITGMAIIAVYQLWKFPNILTYDTGIELKALFYTRHIDWQSIVRMQKKSNMLIIFLGGGGLLLNRLYGLFNAKVWDQPVLLFDSTEEMVIRLEEDIKAHLARNSQ
jgi:hypothetical protein